MSQSSWNIQSQWPADEEIIESCTQGIGANYYILQFIGFSYTETFSCDSWFLRIPPFCALLHAMYLRVSRPLSECLSIEPENDTSQAEEKNQAHVRHNWRDISTLDDPRGDKFRESITPNILVDRDGDENRAGHRFVGVDRVCRGNGWEGSNLKSCTSVADDYNYLFLVSICFVWPL